MWFSVPLVSKIDCDKEFQDMKEIASNGLPSGFGNNVL